MKMLWNMVVKELIQLRRDPRILGVLFIAPIVQLTILAYAATTDIKMIELAVCDLDRSPASRQLIEDFTASTYFRRVATVNTQDALDDFLANGTCEGRDDRFPPVLLPSGRPVVPAESRL